MTQIDVLLYLEELFGLTERFIGHDLIHLWDIQVSGAVEFDDH
mgnify:CR=1 FL=1